MKLLQEYEQMTKYDGRSFAMVFSSPDFSQDPDDETEGEFVHWVRATTPALHTHSASIYCSKSTLLMSSLTDLRLMSLVLLGSP
jgi:hypothetical protein